jgi:hypothetical protein
VFAGSTPVDVSLIAVSSRVAETGNQFVLSGLISKTALTPAYVPNM